MKKFFFLLAMLLMAITEANAESYKDMGTLKLETPDMSPVLVELPANPFANTKASFTSSNSGVDFDFFKQKTNPGVKAYTFMDDMTFVGVPLFVAGWLIKGDKAMFKVNDKEGKKNTQLLTDFKTGIDDYTQYFGPAMTVGLKLAGYEGRSDWPRLLASAGLSYGIMAALVNGIKYTAKEMRPDGSSANSWPSGHTATSFVGATLLHKEYGLTRSPWFSVAGYGVATATGVMRVLNNRHWVSDVMSGAGLGILSGELGYAIANLLFKEKGLLRNDLIGDYDDPSFFGISMGVGLGSKSIDFAREDLVGFEYMDGSDFAALGYSQDYDPDVDENINIQFRASTVVDAEGAYFFNKYFGIGGRLRVRAMSAKTFGQFAGGAGYEAEDNWDAIYNIYNQLYGNELTKEVFAQAVNANGAPVTNIGAIIRSDHMTEFTGSLGFYLNLPLTDRLSLGTKFLIGQSFTQELDIDGYAEGYVKDIDYSLTIKNGQIHGRADDYVNLPQGVKNADGTYQTYRDEWEYLTLGADNGTNYGTGISLTYRYKSNFSWRLFCDYDFSRKTYSFKYDPCHFLRSGLTDNAFSLLGTLADSYLVYQPAEWKKKKRMNYVTLGLSFLVDF